MKKEKRFEIIIYTNPNVSEVKQMFAFETNNLFNSILPSVPFAIIFTNKSRLEFRQIAQCNISNIESLGDDSLTANFKTVDVTAYYVEDQKMIADEVHSTQSELSNISFGMWTKIRYIKEFIKLNMNGDGKYIDAEYNNFQPV